MKALARSEKAGEAIKKVSPGVELAMGDLSNTNALKNAMEGTDVVFHLAAKVSSMATCIRQSDSLAITGYY